MAEHVLKTDMPHYQRVVAGDKPYEVRLNDRHFQEEDTVHLRERDPATGRYTGRQASYIVSHVLRNPHKFWTWEQVDRHGLAVLTLSPPTVAYSDLNPDLAVQGKRPEPGLTFTHDEAELVGHLIRQTIGEFYPTGGDWDAVAALRDRLRQAGITVEHCLDE